MPLSYRVVLLQLAAGLAAAGGLFFWRPADALGAIYATAVCVLPNGYFAWRAHKERSPSRLLGAGVAKFVCTAGLMVAVFWLLHPAPLGFLGVLVLMQLAHVAGSLGAGGPQ